MEGSMERSASLLIADDDEDFLSLLGEYLTLRGYHVATVTSGLDALQWLRNQRCQILVTDIVLPDISGLGLIEISRREFPNLPIIAMTGYGNPVRDLAHEKSPDYQLAKPFDLQELADAIATVLCSRRFE